MALIISALHDRRIRLGVKTTLVVERWLRPSGHDWAATIALRWTLHIERVVWPFSGVKKFVCLKRISDLAEPLGPVFGPTATPLVQRQF